MHIQKKVLDDLDEVLYKTIGALKVGDLNALAEYSQNTIHNASVYQDNISIDIAIILYSLSKLLKQRKYVSKKFLSLLLKLKYTIHKSPQDVESQLQYILNQIASMDKSADMSIMHVIDQARIKKGSMLYKHGISLSQSAKRLGVSQWELYNYIGKMRFSDMEKESISNMKKRLEYARELLHRDDVFLGVDAGAIITLTLNNLLWTLPKLKQLYNIDLVVPDAVYTELITQPLDTKRHKLEAFWVMEYLNNKTLTCIKDEQVTLQAKQIMHDANHVFFAYGHPVHIVDEGEIETIALLQKHEKKTVLMDERTLRFLIESPNRLSTLLEKRLKTKITVDKQKLMRVNSMFRGIKVIRTAELITALFEKGEFNSMYAQAIESNIPDARKQLLEGLLWGLKLNGCAITEAEIYSISQMIIKK